MHKASRSSLTSTSSSCRTPLREGLYVTLQTEARALGIKLRAQKVASPPENLSVFARQL
jgi:hypothetical protein